MIEEYHRFEMSYTCIYFFFTHYEYALRSYNAYKKGWDGAMYNSNNFLHQQKCTKPLSLIKHDRRLKNNDFASIFNMFCNKFDLCSPFRKSKDDISYRTHCIKYINLLQARGQMVWSALIQNRGGNQAKRLQFFGYRNYYVNNS